MSEPIKPFADAAETAIALQAQAYARATQLPPDVAWSQLVAALIARWREASPQLFTEHDGRVASWRVRVRLYRADRADEPEADSDPDLPPDKPGATILPGLPAVAEHLATLAQGFHAGAAAGLDNATLRHRLKGLRPTISRRGGDAVWRVPYRVAVAGSAQDWLARVDVERVR